MSLPKRLRTDEKISSSLDTLTSERPSFFEDEDDGMLEVQYSEVVIDTDDTEGESSHSEKHVVVDTCVWKQGVVQEPTSSGVRRGFQIPFSLACANPSRYDLGCHRAFDSFWQMILCFSRYFS